MTRTRIINAVLAIVFLILTLALPVRGLIASRDYAAEATARGEVVFNADDRNSAAKSAQYIMLCLFGSLTLVYAWRSIQGTSTKTATEPSQR